MDAANPLCRCFLLAVGLGSLFGCQSDQASKIAPLSRAQQPVEPLAPVAPPAPVTGAPVPFSPIAPLKPDGRSVISPLGGSPVTGSPVPPDAKGPVVNTSASVGTAADLLRASVPRVKVVAAVGAHGVPNYITDQEVIEGVYQQYRELATLDGHARTAKQKEMYSQVLRKTIERELILDEMYAKLKKANKMNVIDEIKEFASTSTDRQMRAFRTDSGAKSDQEFADMLRAQGLTVQVIRRQMERQLMAEQYVSSALKEKGRRAGLGEIRDYYDKHPDQFQVPERVKWQHLFVAFKNHPNPQAAYNHIQALGQQAASGTDFAALAVQYDEGFAKQQKGFGTGEKRNEVQPADLEATVWALKPGQTSGVIQTATGYHLVKVVERDFAGLQPFDTAVQAKIREKLSRLTMQTEYQKLVDELWRKAVVRVFEE